MGINSEQIGSFFTKLIQKGDPQAAMAAGKGPVTAEWAAQHGYRKFRSPSIPSAKESLEMAGDVGSLYTIYAKHQEQKKRIRKVKDETKKKRREIEERRRTGRLLRRPTRERGIL